MNSRLGGNTHARNQRIVTVMAQSAKKAAWCAVAVVLLSSPLLGQSGTVQRGRAHDANPRVGSGGYNRARGSSRRFDSQLYVTGQVSGLRAFRGSIGYYAANQLNLDLPSGTLSGFRRQSVGLADIVVSDSYRPVPYYDQATTAWRAAGIVAGRGRPGLSLSGIVPSVPASGQLYVDARPAYQPIAPSSSGQVLATARAIPRVVQVDGPRSDVADYLKALQLGATARPGGETLFGVLRPKEQSQLVQELSEAAIAGEAIEAGVDAQVVAEVDRSVRAEAARPHEPAQAEPEPQGEPTPPVPGPDGETEPPQPSGFRADQDVFVDLLRGLQEQRRLESDPAGGRHEQGEAVRRSSGDPTFRATGRRAAARRAGGQAPAGAAGGARQRPAVGLSSSGGVVLHSLAGRHKDMFNIAMSKAESKLKAGEYYRAAGGYELAVTFNPKNPLARLGLGLALLGAGEPLAAGLSIRRAVELFPSVMEASVDIAAMMDMEVFRRRVVGLEKRIARQGQKPDSRLVFAAAFVHHNTGGDRKARAYARKLSAMAGEDQLLRSYAQFVLTGRRPTDHPDTAPATP